MSQKNFARGIFWMILASSSFAIMAAAAKYCGRRLPVPEIILVRSLLSSIFIAFLIFKTKISWRARGDPLPRPTCREQRLAAWVGKNPTILASRGAVGFVALTLYFWAVSRLDLGTAVMLNYTSPIFALLLARVFMGEHAGGSARAAVLISFAGVYLLCAPHFQAQPAALIAGLLSGVLAGSVHVLIRQSHEEDSSLTIIFYFTAICTLGSALMIGSSGLVQPTRGEWLALGIVTLTSLLGQFGLTYALKCAPVWVVTPFGYFTPIFGALLGWVLWKEPLNTWGLAGGILIISGGALIYRSIRSWPET